MLLAAAGAAIGAALSLLLALSFLAMSLPYLRAWRRTRGWKRVQATVLTWTWVKRQEQGKDRYVPDIVCRYEVDGKTYETREFDELPGEADSTLDAPGESHAPGETVVIYYNPADPSHAAYTRQAGGCAFAALLAAVLLAALGGYCVYEFSRPEPQPKIIHGPE